MVVSSNVLLPIESSKVCKPRPQRCKKQEADFIFLLKIPPPLPVTFGTQPQGVLAILIY